MKKHLLLIIGIIILNFNSKAQNNSDFGFYEPNKSVPCITEQQHLAIEKKLEKSRDELVRRRILQPRNPNRIMTTLFAWPVEQTNGLNDYGVHGISNFVDQNMAYPNQLLDYNCGTRTYDTPSGYNHRGVDIYTWPFPWYKMDSSQVKIVAAAPGTILDKDDGNFDRNCSSNGNNWNAVYVEHSDGSVAWYGHMKNGSLTNKAIGQTVVTGEYLGIVGSSGNSTGPHLHFEVYDDIGGNLIDPYSGSCNSLNSISWWASQRPYYDSGINALRTQSAPAVNPACPQIETHNEKNQFCVSQQVYFLSYHRDQQAGQVSQYKVFRPDNSIWVQGSQSHTAFFSTTWWSRSHTLPSNAVTGVWKFEVNYNGQVYERLFDVNGITTITASGNITFCGGDSVTLQAPLGQYGFNYQWKLNGIDINGATNSIYTVFSSGSYSCLVSTLNGCTTTSNTITVNVTSPTATITPSGTTTFCQGGSVMLSVNSASTYLWSNGATVQSITVATAGNYTVMITDVNGCSATSSPITVTVNSLPAATITAQGPITFCSGGSVILAANIGTNFTYQWKKGANLIVGATSQTYTATTSGTYKVIVTNASSCSKTSAGKVITVNPKPAATITAVGPTNFCTGGSVVLNANTGAGLSYQWQKNNVNILNAVDSSYTATATGNYKVIVTNANGCSKTSSAVVVTGPPNTTITVTGSLTICPPDSVKLSVPLATGLTYQWKKNNANITGATLQFYYAKDSGDYKVTVTNSFGCSKTSGIKHVSISCPIPTFRWVSDFPGGTHTHICADQQGNTYITGIFFSSFTIGTFTLSSSSGNGSVYLAKFDPNGDVLWAIKIVDNAQVGVNPIYCDLSGNIYIVGLVAGTQSFYSVTSNSFLSTNNHGGYTNYVAKYNLFGNLQWVRRSTTTFGYQYETNSVCVDLNKNVYILGLFSQTTSFGPFVLTSTGTDIFVAKYDSTGIVQWVSRSYGSGYAPNIAVDNNGNSIIVGSYGDSINFSTGFIYSQNHSGDIFITKYNSNGALSWVKSFGGNDSDYGTAITTDNTGNIYATGRFKGTANFDSITYNSSGDYDGFLLKLNSTGGIGWVKKFGSIGNESSNSINFFNNKISLTGNFNSTCYFDNLSLSAAGSLGCTLCADLYVSQYNDNGTIRWVKRAGVSNYIGEEGFSISNDLVGNIYVGGKYYDGSDFDTIIVNADVFAQFIGKIGLPNNEKIAVSNSINTTAFSIYPNPTSGNFIIEFNSLYDKSNCKIEIYNSLGQSVFQNSIEIKEGENQKEINLSKFPSGIYFLNLRTENEVFRHKIIKE